jgi:hypothetical protein
MSKSIFRIVFFVSALTVILVANAAGPAVNPNDRFLADQYHKLHANCSNCVSTTDFAVYGAGILAHKQ